MSLSRAARRAGRQRPGGPDRKGQPPGRRSRTAAPLASSQRRPAVNTPVERAAPLARALGRHAPVMHHDGAPRPPGDRAHRPRRWRPRRRARRHDGIGPLQPARRPGDAPGEIRPASGRRRGPPATMWPGRNGSSPRPEPRTPRARPAPGALAWTLSSRPRAPSGRRPRRLPRARPGLGRPVERRTGLDQFEPRDRGGGGALSGSGAGPRTARTTATSRVGEAPRKVERIGPHAADRIGGDQDATAAAFTRSARLCFIGALTTPPPAGKSTSAGAGAARPALLRAVGRASSLAASLAADGRRARASAPFADGQRGARPGRGSDT